MTGETKETAILSALSRMTGAAVILTLGERGALYSDGVRTVKAPAFPVNAVDTTGAGDIFGGSAMSRFLSLHKAPADLTGDDLRAITAFACTAASLSTQKHGGITSVPEMAEVLSRLG